MKSRTRSKIAPTTADPYEKAYLEREERIERALIEAYKALNKYLEAFSPTATDESTLNNQLNDLQLDIQCLNHGDDPYNRPCFRCNWCVPNEEWKPPFHSKFPGFLTADETDSLFRMRETLTRRIRELIDLRQNGPQAAIERLLAADDIKAAVFLWQKGSRPKQTLYDTAGVHKSDYYKWEKGQIRKGSPIDARLRKTMIATA